MAEPHLFNGLGVTLVECFSLASVSSFFAQLREPTLPPVRVIIATCVYTGFSGCAIALIWITYYGAERHSFLYFTSVVAGLGTADVLSAIWSKVLPALINYVWRKATGENLVGSTTGQNASPPNTFSIPTPGVTPPVPLLVEKPDEPNKTS